jgi:hypothetical protein
VSVKLLKQLGVLDCLLQSESVLNMFGLTPHSEPLVVPLPLLKLLLLSFFEEERRSLLLSD